METDTRTRYPKRTVKRRLPHMTDAQVMSITKMYYRFSLHNADRESNYHRLYYQCYAEAIKRDLLKPGDKP